MIQLSGHRMEKETSLLAMDLGTTTLAALLLNTKGQILAKASVANPQQAEGRDVISRLEAAYKGNSALLQTLLANGIRQLLDKVCSDSGLKPEKIQKAAAAGNPAITSLLQRVNIRTLLFPPHLPPSRDGVYLSQSELDLGLSVPLFLFPLVNGFVGGDLLAVLYAQKPEAFPAFYLDIGTNGEIALFTGRQWLVTSVAAGPAFEAAGITWGIPARSGAIEGVALDSDRLRLKTIGGIPPQGICGSGLAELIAAALQGGLIDRSGTIRPTKDIDSNLARYVGENFAGNCLRVYRDAEVEITLSQQDIRSFQLAKGAVLAGVECLMEKAGIRAEDIQRVYLTGAFGLSILPETLKTVAMLPAKMLDKVVFVPNGVLAGVCQYLLSPAGHIELQDLAESLTPFPLSGSPAFEKAFLKALNF